MERGDPATHPGLSTPASRPPLSTALSWQLKDSATLIPGLFFCLSGPEIQICTPGDQKKARRRGELLLLRLAWGLQQGQEGKEGAASSEDDASPSSVHQRLGRCPPVAGEGRIPDCPSQHDRTCGFDSTHKDLATSVPGLHQRHPYVRLNSNGGKSRGAQRCRKMPTSGRELTEH
jgi:hypothetical protein